MLSNTTDLSAYAGDVYLYYGDVHRLGYQAVSDALERKVKCADKACLILVTYGGDAAAAYRIARAFHHYYRHLEVLVPDMCKSAGTLICIGAQTLIFGDRGELGPLDVQISKPDEMFERMSGLDIVQAINALREEVLTSFRSYLVDIRGGSRITTALAADIATKLADGFVSPIACKIDPVTLGAHQRATRIAYDYGSRLDGMVHSLKQDALIKLVADYPSHSFVIDRKEATKLFKDVQAPSDTTRPIYDWVRSVLEEQDYPESPDTLVIDVKAHLSTQSDGENHATKEQPSANDKEGHVDQHATDGSGKQESSRDQPNVIGRDERQDHRTSRLQRVPK